MLFQIGFVVHPVQCECRITVAGRVSQKVGKTMKICSRCAMTGVIYKIILLTDFLMEKEKNNNKGAKRKRNYEGMKGLFPIVAHNHQRVSKAELDLVNVISQGTFVKRIVGFERLVAYRKAYPNDAIVLISNHLSEADFLETMTHFYNNDERLLIQGGDNLFVEDVKISNNFMDLHFNIDQYLRSKGAFQVIRKPKQVILNGETIALDQKDVLALNKAYIFDLVKEGEMFLQYPGQSELEGKVKYGRAYNGSIDQFSRAMFQMLIEASIFADKEVHIVPVNISYESVLEDTLFRELLRVKDNGMEEEEIYMTDIGYVIGEYINPERRSKLCLKFGKPEPMQIKGFWKRYGLGKKATAGKIAHDCYVKVMSMQTPFAPHIFFESMKERDELKFQHLAAKIPLIMEIMALRGTDMHFLKEGENFKAPGQIIDETLEAFGKRQIIKNNDDVVQILRKDVTEQYRNHISYIMKMNPVSEEGI